ncbi:hypothetical protein SH528x_007339 [Novipirellula sp. SH528]|uniref:hypothetical protein n=1 Tax=Novipirellula sp. SH528 TaxID=3454466 RepID=UPI003F9F5942
MDLTLLKLADDIDTMEPAAKAFVLTIDPSLECSLSFTEDAVKLVDRQEESVLGDHPDD